jgi:RecA-family ATPase
MPSDTYGNDAFAAEPDPPAKGKPVPNADPERRRDEDAATLPSEPLHVINPAAWQGQPIPQRRWIVLDWIPYGVATGLYGPPGHGKTLILQQLMTATALTKPWLGQAANRIKSIAFLCEDDEDELHRRQEEINRHYKCEYADLRDFVRFVPRLGYDNVMMTFRDGRPLRTPFYDQVLSESRSFGAQLVILDTIADTFGGDQNTMGHARQFVQGLAAIAREIDGAVVAAAHPSQHGKATGSGESGSVQWDAAFRSRAYLDMPKPEGGEAPDDDARILSRVKANYARKGETIPLRWQNGVFISTATPTGIFGSIQRKTCEHVVLDFVEQMTREKQWLSINKRAGNYAPRIFMQRPPEARQGFKTPDFERAIQGLLARGELINQLYGRKDDQRHRLARVNGADHDTP